MNFRKDINGLRAIAVIGVVLYHFNPNWMPGGFAGVDVFFVISGFLMTKIIFSGVENNTFSLLKFYVSRANRIIPALAVLCLVLMIAGWIYSPPIEYRALGKHVASSLLFLSNIIYWSEAGYFAVESHGKWLLHTWSLSVEWQFYIIYPIIIFVMRKYISIKTMKLLIVACTILSFLFCVISSYKWPDLAYYILPTRAWEMMVGGIAYLFPFNLMKKNRKIMEIFGVLLILISYVFFSKNTMWPGYLALIPVLGTFFIIQANRNKSIITGNDTFQKLGFWSYSIYLWHWPIVVVFYNYSLPFNWIYAGIVLSVVLGFLSFNYIEKIKFNNNFNILLDYLKCKPIYMVLLLSSFGSFIFLTNGFEYHYPKNVIIANSAANDKPAFNKFCFSTNSGAQSYCVYHSVNEVDRIVRAPVKAIVLGDSHGGSLVLSVIESLSKESDGDVIFYGRSGCLPIKGLTSQIDKGTNICSDYAEGVDDLLKKYPLANVIIANRLSVYFWGQNEYKDNLKMVAYHNNLLELKANAADLKNRYKNLIAQIASTHNVYIIKPIPEQLVNVPVEKARSLLLKKEFTSGISISDYEKRNDFVLSMLDEVESNVNVELLDPTLLMCKGNVCLNSLESRPLYYDDDHLTTFGAKYLSSMLDSIWF